MEPTGRSSPICAARITGSATPTYFRMGLLKRAACSYGTFLFRSAVRAEDAAAREFEKLRAEVAALRRDVAQAGTATAKVARTDYSQTLGEIARDQRTIDAQIKAVAKHTGANLTAGYFQAEVARGVDVGLRTPAKLLLDTREALIHVIDRVKDEERELEKERRTWWWRVLGGGFVIGLATMLTFVLAGVRHVSHSWSEGIAARTIGRSAPEAGAQLIEHADPEQWRKIDEGYALREAGGRVLQDCLARVKKMGKPLRCVVTLIPGAK